jgi:hypothetical protein
MRAYPYIIENVSDGSGKKLARLDPRGSHFDERWLQDILVKYPDLLPTAEIEPVFYPLFVAGREVQVAGGRIDVLYMSASGYPVIVETKLWRNPESKREVVAQVLDLAFAFSKWEYEQLDDLVRRYTGRFDNKEMSLYELLESKFADPELDYADFRDIAERNLELGRFLVAVVGDRIHESSYDIFTTLNRYPGLGLEFSMIELECFELQSGQDSSLLVVPRIAKRTKIIEKSIVEVRIEKEATKPEIKITQEKAQDKGVVVKRLTLTETDFWERIKKNVPQSYEKLLEFVDEYRNQAFIEMKPGSNGLVFRKILSEYDRNVSLFYITTDSCVNVKLQAPRQQFANLGFDSSIVEKFGQDVKEILDGFKAPITEIDIQSFNKVISEFIDKLDQLESGN